MEMIDFYESYRKVTSGVLYGIENKEQIFIRLADHDYRLTKPRLITRGTMIIMVL